MYWNKLKGVPEFSEGQRVILLLVNHKSHFFVNEFSMGAFYQMRLKSASSVALRGLDRIDSDISADTAIKLLDSLRLLIHRVRDFTKFADYIERLSNKREAASEYMVQVSLLEVTEAREFEKYSKRFTPFTSGAGNPIRYEICHNSC